MSHGTTLLRNGKMATWLHRRRAYRRLAGRSLRPDLSDTVVGALTLLSGVLVATVMPETLDEEGRKRRKERKTGERVRELAQV